MSKKIPNSGCSRFGYSPKKKDVGTSGNRLNCRYSCSLYSANSEHPGTGGNRREQPELILGEIK